MKSFLTVVLGMASQEKSTAVGGATRPTAVE